MKAIQTPFALLRVLKVDKRDYDMLMEQAPEDLAPRDRRCRMLLWNAVQDILAKLEEEALNKPFKTKGIELILKSWDVQTYGSQVEKKKITSKIKEFRETKKMFENNSGHTIMDVEDENGSSVSIS